jgi:aminoglycoside phosphotransferase (APT) family kinase protein
MELLDRIEARWGTVVDICDRAPRTIVHGDLVGKNMRVRAVGSRRELVALDWETAGVGVPSIDFKLLHGEFTHYEATVESAWPNVSLAQLHQLAGIGRIFRSLAVLHWGTWDLAYPWCSARVFDSFVDRLKAGARSLESGDWA